MIPISRLHEFGFEGPDKFPQYLDRHTITLTLPSAAERGLDPLDVVIEDGLVIPQQSAGSSGGMVIRSDGTMLYITHRDPQDPSTPLEAKFIRDIPYDARIEASNIMRRAVEVDSSLSDIWQKVHAVWTVWFPPLEGAGLNLSAGEFTSIVAAWGRISELFARLIEQVLDKGEDTASLHVRVVLQSGAEFSRGWQGEETLVDEMDIGEIIRMDRVKYLLQRLFPRLQKALKDPVFSPDSVFHVYYGSRRNYLVRLVIFPVENATASAVTAAGIEFNLSDLDREVSGESGG
jgi:hypothetical protein